MNINWKRQYGVLGNLIVFAVGCLAVVVPFFIRASIDHADETARQEQTMGPGITMFMGMIVAPLGGVVTLILWRWWRRRLVNVEIRDVNEETC